MIRNLVLHRTLVALMVAFLSGSTVARAALVKLAEAGELQPDGTNLFSGLQIPVRNERGQVAFSTVSPLHGLFLANGETVSTIAIENEPAPDANGSFSTFHSPPAVNESNQVFLGNLVGTLGGSSDNVGIYQVSGGVLTELARKGKPATPESGTFTGFANASVPVNRSGQTAFIGMTTSNTVALFRSTGTNLTRLAYYNEPLPDGNGALDHSIASPALNNHGEVAFFDTIQTSTNSTSFGFFLATGSALKVLVRAQQPTPDGDGIFFFFPYPLTELNDEGQIAFEATLTATTGGATDNGGLYRTDGTTTVQLARKGQLVPDGNGRFLNFGQYYAAINNSGQVAFLANLTSTTGGTSDNAGIFLADGITVKQLVRKGQPAPDGNGVFLGVGRPVLNNAGQVAFRATLTGTSGGTADNQGVYLSEADGPLRLIIRLGQVVNGETVSSTPLNLDGPNFGGMSALNDAGQLSIISSLNGHAAVLLWGLPKITAVTRTGDDIDVLWDTVGGQTNFIQATSNLSDGFTNIGSVVIGTNRVGHTNFLDLGGATQSSRFYRISQSR